MGDLINLACNRWGISSKQGWFPALIAEGRIFEKDGYELRLDDDIPTDLSSFIKQHNREFVFDWQARRQGFRSYRRYGDMVTPLRLDGEGEVGDELPAEWGSDDIHIILVTMITGG